jgi:hypothetical protein
MRILYVDGSGNKYIITDAKRKTIEYVPVKPVSSSSGIYDGGKHIKKSLNEAIFSRIHDSIMAALYTLQSHTRDRVMGSGFITVEESGKESSCILKPGAAERLAIETMLKQALE